jgi:hypothetical protein
MSVRRSRRLAGLEPVTENVLVVREKMSPVKAAEAPNMMQMISQYLFFLVWTTFLLRGVLLR